MKFCTKCGAQLTDDAAFCCQCGHTTGSQPSQAAAVSPADRQRLLSTLSQRVNTNAIIWLVIGILQVVGGIFFSMFLLVVGVLNIISSIQDMQYSKSIAENPKGIIAQFEPLVRPIITLVYNLVIGGVIGVVGSIYYFVAIRSYVMENRDAFASFDN